MSLSRKRKKELRKLQTQANNLWEAQQVLVGEAATVAREAGRQLGNFSREQVVPRFRTTYGRYAAPYVDKGVQFSKQVLNDTVVPAAGAVVGSALSVWDAANDTRPARSGKGSSAGCRDLRKLPTSTRRLKKLAASSSSRPAEVGHRRRRRHRDHPRRRRGARHPLRRVADAARRRRAVGCRRPAARPGCLIRD